MLISQSFFSALFLPLFFLFFFSRYARSVVYCTFKGVGAKRERERERELSKFVVFLFFLIYLLLPFFQSKITATTKETNSNFFICVATGIFLARHSCFEFLSQTTPALLFFFYNFVASFGGRVLPAFNLVLWKLKFMKIGGKSKLYWEI